MAFQRRGREDQTLLGGGKSHNGGRGSGRGLMHWIKLGFGVVATMACVKLFFFTNPVSLEDDQSLFRNNTIVEFSTESGNFQIELLPKYAPRTVERFLKVVNTGFYGSGKTGFYRSEPGFVLQGGGFLTESVPEFGPLEVEYNLKSEERMVVMARKKHAMSGGTEIAIMLADNSDSNAPSGDNPGYTAFGRIVRGWNTVNKIVKSMDEGFLDKKEPSKLVVFKSATVLNNVVLPNDPELRKIYDEIADYIDTENVITMFSKSFCPYCKKAKQIFNQIGAEFKAIELDLMPNGGQYQDVLEVMTGQRTVPNIFINGKSIGGASDAEALHKSGELTKLAQDAGALAKSFILKTINSNPLVVFAKSYCPYCKKVKGILASMNAKAEIVELDLRDDGRAIQFCLAELTGQNTVPNVFVGGKTIGGCDDTERLERSGELKLLLQKAGAL